jgi:predicted nuclease with TOPRIM domain
MTNNQLQKSLEELEVRLTNDEFKIESLKEENAKLRRKVCRLLKKQRDNNKRCKTIHSTFMY